MLKLGRYCPWKTVSSHLKSLLEILSSPQLTEGLRLEIRFRMYPTLNGRKQKFKSFTMWNPRAWPQQLMLEEVCKRIQHCCATLRRSQNQKNVGSCWLKRLFANKFASVWTRSKVWQSNESARLPLMWPRFKSRRRCHSVSWVCSERFFLRVLRFSPFLKNLHLQILIPPGIRLTKNHFVDVLPTDHYLFILLKYFFYLTLRGPALSVVANLFCFSTPTQRCTLNYCTSPACLTTITWWKILKEVSILSKWVWVKTLFIHGSYIK